MFKFIYKHFNQIENEIVGSTIVLNDVSIILYKL